MRTGQWYRFMEKKNMKLTKFRRMRPQPDAIIVYVLCVCVLLPDLAMKGKKKHLANLWLDTTSNPSFPWPNHHPSSSPVVDLKCLDPHTVSLLRVMSRALMNRFITPSESFHGKLSSQRRSPPASSIWREPKRHCCLIRNCHPG